MLVSVTARHNEILKKESYCVKNKQQDQNGIIKRRAKIKHSKMGLQRQAWKVNQSFKKKLLSLIKIPFRALTTSR